MMSAFFRLQHTLNRLFNNYIKYNVILILGKFFLKYEGRFKLTPSRKNYPQKQSVMKVKWLLSG